MKRIAFQFTPYSWVKFEWKPASSLRRWLAVCGIIFIVRISFLFIYGNYNFHNCSCLLNIVNRISSVACCPHVLFLRLPVCLPEWFFGFIIGGIIDVEQYISVILNLNLPDTLPWGNWRMLKGETGASKNC